MIQKTIGRLRTVEESPYQPPDKGESGWTLALSCLVLFLLQVTINLLIVRAANSQGTLTGEEASTAFRDVFFLTLRRQYHPFASNFGAHVLYLLGSYLLPHTGLFYGRLFKALVMAFLPSLLFLLGTTRLRFPVWISFSVSLLAGILPITVAFSWISIETGLDCVLGFSAILLGTSKRPFFILISGMLAGFSAITYGAGVSFIPIVLVSYFLYLGEAFSLRRFVLVGLATSFMGLVIAIPLMWWTNPATILLGGGTFSLASVPFNFKRLIEELVVEGKSYYYFCHFPALSSSFLGVLGFLGILTSIKHWKQRWPLYLGLLCSCVVYCISGREIGIRRGIPIVLMLCLFVGSFLSLLAYKRDLPRGLLVFGLSASLFITPLWQYVRTYQDLEKGHIRLPIDFRFPLRTGANMKETVAALKDNPQALTIIMQSYEPDRTLALLHLITTRNKEPAADLFSKTRISAYYKTGRLGD